MAGIGAALAAPGAASATSCSAEALGVSLFGGAPIEPVSADAGPRCTDREGALDAAALGALQVGAVTAATTGDTSGGSADASVTQLRLGPDAVTGTLTASLLGGSSSMVPALQANVAALAAPGSPLLTALAPLTALGLQVSGTDAAALTVAAQTNLPDALQLTLPDVLAADALQARAQATCQHGRAGLSGSGTLTGLRVAGLSVDPDGTAAQVLSLDTAQLQLAQILQLDDVLRGIRVTTAPLSPLSVVIGPGETSLHDLLVAPGGLLGALDALLAPASISGLLSSVTTALTPSLTATSLSLPDGLLRATVTPRSQSSDGDTLTSSVGNVTITALGVPVLSGPLAQARATIAGLDCSLPPVDRTPPGGGGGGGGGYRIAPQRADPGYDTARYGTRAAALALACKGTRVRLIDVRRSGRGTLVRGYAERPLSGERVAIRLRAGKGKVVGRTSIRKDGTFAMRVALPPSKIRHTSKARYDAVVGGKRTKALKFQRRLTLLRATSDHGTVTFSGHLSAPRPRPARTIAIQERVTCGRYRTVARAKPKRNGRFTATFAAPQGQEMAVYRAVTKTPTTAPSRKLHPTYTLPRIVKLEQ